VSQNGSIPPFLFSFHFTWIFSGKKEGRSVIAARSLQLVVDNPVSLLWAIPNVFSVSPFTLLDPEEMFQISALQLMNKCSLFQNNPTLWFLLTGFNLLFFSLSLHFLGVSLGIRRECD
jgi:hypothetical protein